MGTFSSSAGKKGPGAQTNKQRRAWLLKHLWDRQREGDEREERKGEKEREKREMEREKVDEKVREMERERVIYADEKLIPVHHILTDLQCSCSHLCTRVFESRIQGITLTSEQIESLMSDSDITTNRDVREQNLLSKK